MRGAWVGGGTVCSRHAGLAANHKESDAIERIKCVNCCEISTPTNPSVRSRAERSCSRQFDEQQRQLTHRIADVVEQGSLNAAVILSCSQTRVFLSIDAPLP
jgi:hypothetical protein